MLLFIYQCILILFIISCFNPLVSTNKVNLERIYNQHDPNALVLEDELNLIFNDQDYFELAGSYYDQILDHFNPQVNQTWKQRFFIGNEKAWTENDREGPIFLYVGGESNLHSSSVKKGAQFEQAKKYNALLVALEHRYYGESVPTESLSTSNLKYLSSRQGLEDLAGFRNWIADVYKAQNNTWIVFGCSYPGCLSAWFHMKYPHLVDGSIAGSAPVEAEASFYQYDQQIAESAGEKCSHAIRQATTKVENLLQKENSTQVKQSFKCEMIDDDVAFLYAIADMVAYAVQYGYKDKLCNQFMLKDEPYTAYKKYTEWLLNNLLKTSCNEFNLLTSTYTKPNPSKNMRQWMYQSCNEFGYFQTAPQNNSLRSSRITLDWHYSVCDQLFGKPFRPHVQRTNLNYGGNQINTTKTIFTNGSLDPWKHLSITKSNKESHSRGVDTIVIDDKAHCANFYQNDTKAVRKAREKVSSYIGCFLDPASSCPADCEKNGGICQGDCTCFYPTKPDHNSGGQLSDKQVIAISAVAVVVGCAVGASIVGVCQNFCFKRKSSFVELE